MTKLALGFWNLSKSESSQQNAIAFCKELANFGHDSLIFLTEAEKVDALKLATALNEFNSGWSVLKPSISKKFLFVANCFKNVAPLDMTEPYTWGVQYKNNSNSETVNVFGVHLEAPVGKPNSKPHADRQARNLRSYIEKREADLHSDCSVLIGDFNLDPYSEQMHSPEYMSATNCKNIAKSLCIYKLNSERQPVRFFYNPMWGVIGSESQVGAPGSFRYKPGKDDHLWHAYDQIIVRPPLIDRIEARSIGYFTMLGELPLIGKTGRPKDNISDHLPVYGIIDMETTNDN